MSDIRKEVLDLRNEITQSEDRLKTITTEWQTRNSELNELLKSIDVVSSQNTGHETRRLNFLMELVSYRT